MKASGTTLYEWAAGRTIAPELPGRGPVYAVEARFPGPDGGGRWAVRHYHRGGAVASVLGDRYVAMGASRPLRELRASVEARARGVPTPAVIAGATYPHGIFYRADLVTELIPNGRNLSDAVFGAAPDDGRDATGALRAAGRLVRCLEDTRIIHPDLNAMNVLVTGTADAALAHALDLDRCVVWRPGTRRPADSMRHRLERSLRKVGARRGRRMTEEDWGALRAGFRERV